MLHLPVELFRHVQLQAQPDHILRMLININWRFSLQMRDEALLSIIINLKNSLNCMECGKTAVIDAACLSACWQQGCSAMWNTSPCAQATAGIKGNSMHKHHSFSFVH